MYIGLHVKYRLHVKYPLLLNKIPTRRTLVLKSLKTLFYFYSARHVSDTTVSIIRSFLLLHMQSLVTVWCWVGCFLQPCSVTTAALGAVVTEQGWRKQPTQHHTVTRDCMCSNKMLLMMDTVVSETCRAE